MAVSIQKPSSFVRWPDWLEISLNSRAGALEAHYFARGFFRMCARFFFFFAPENGNVFFRYWRGFEAHSTLLSFR